MLFRSVKWKIPLSKDRTEPHATPVPTMTITASSAATVRPTGRARVTAVTSVSAGTCPGYWRDRLIPGIPNRRARLVIVVARIVITGAGENFCSGGDVHEIIGPLTRDAVTALAFGEPVPVPTLALNIPDQTGRAPENLFMLSLQVESEARQAAQLAFRENRRKTLIITGANPVISKWSFLQVSNPIKRLRDMEARGAKIYIVDPRHTETAKVVGEHVFIRPGTDVFYFDEVENVTIAPGQAFDYAIVATLLTEGRADGEILQMFCVRSGEVVGLLSLGDPKPHREATPAQRQLVSVSTPKALR